MLITIKSGIPTSLYVSPKNGVQYMIIEEGNSTIKLSSAKVDISKIVLLEQYLIEAEVSGRLYNNQMSLNVETISFQKPK